MGPVNQKLIVLGQGGVGKGGSTAVSIQYLS